MPNRARPKSIRWRVARWSALGTCVPALWACTSRNFESPNVTPTLTERHTVTQKLNNNLDLLFMIDNSSSMDTMQTKLLAQLKTFMQVLEGLPNGLPNLHLAVVSSDLGAPSDHQSSINCTVQGDQGKFQSAPRGTCTATTLAASDSFLSTDTGQQNFTDPIEDVFQCIAFLGATGCGFEHQLASVDRALGADGSGPPATNANFLRPDAFLGIVLLTNEDDCSAPPNTTIYSLNGQPLSVRNADGPLANYRCNGGPRGGHRCTDPATKATIVPPLLPPPDATGTPPMLALTGCEDNDDGALTPVSKFVADIKGLKTDPDAQILVAAITAPATPYAVEWLPVPVQDQSSDNTGELWPSVMHSCGPAGESLVNPNATQTTTDGSFGDPGVRITQFVNSFQNGLVASVCDPSYAASMNAIATALGHLIKPACIGGNIQKDKQGQPMCTVTNVLTDASQNMTYESVPNCAENGGAAPCWTLAADSQTCPQGGQALKLNQDTRSMNADKLDSTVECSICAPGSTEPGC